VPKQSRWGYYYLPITNGRLTATKAELYYTLYNELLELNPEKPEGGERIAEGNIIYIQSSLLELNPETEKSKKGGKRGKKC